MRALIDADIVAFRTAAAAENEDEGIAKYYAEKLIDDIVDQTKSDSFQLYLTGQTNFRYQIYPEYKVARLEQPRPRHLAYLRSYFIDHLHATVSDGCEADDLLAIALTEDTTESTVCCSLDKDLLQVPGKHFSWEIGGRSSLGKAWVREASYKEVSKEEGIKFFYTQLLTGDVTDNIKGAPGIGKVKAAKLLDGLTNEEDLFDACRPLFSCDEEMLMNGQVLWLWRQLNGTWVFPDFTE